MTIWIHCIDIEGSECYIKAQTSAVKPSEQDVKKAADIKFSELNYSKFNVKNYKIVYWCKY